MAGKISNFKPGQTTVEGKGEAALTCVSCHHWKMMDGEAGICFGVPPTPVVVGQRRNMIGQMEAQIDCLRPVLKGSEPACGQYRPAASKLILGVTGNG